MDYIGGVGGVGGGHYSYQHHPEPMKSSREMIKELNEMSHHNPDKTKLQHIEKDLMAHMDSTHDKKKKDAIKHVLDELKGNNYSEAARLLHKIHF